MRGDLIRVCKIMRGIDMVKCTKYFTQRWESTTRGHRLKVRGERFNWNRKDNFFHTESGGSVK